MESNNSKYIEDIKKELSNRGWEKEGLEKYTDPTLRGIYNACIEKSNVLLQFTSYVMKILDINTHNFFDLKDSISGNSRETIENLNKFKKMVNHIKQSYLYQLKNDNLDELTKDLIDRASTMFTTLGAKEYISVYMVEKLYSRGVDIDFSKSEDIKNPKLLPEHSLLTSKTALYYDFALSKVDLTKEIPIVKTKSNSLEDDIYESNKGRFIKAIGITADKLKPSARSSNSSDSMANLILDNIGYDISNSKERVVALMTTLKLVKCLPHDNIQNAKATINELEDELARNIILLDKELHMEELNTKATRKAQSILSDMQINVAKNLATLYNANKQDLIGKKNAEKMLIACGFYAQQPISVDTILSKQKKLREKIVENETDVNETPNEKPLARNITELVIDPIDKMVYVDKKTKTSTKETTAKKPTTNKSKTETKVKKTKAKQKEKTTVEPKTKEPRLTEKIIAQKSASKGSSTTEETSKPKQEDTDEAKKKTILNKVSERNIQNANGNLESLEDYIGGFIYEISRFIKTVYRQINMIVKGKSDTLNFKTFTQEYLVRKEEKTSLSCYLSKLAKSKEIEIKDFAITTEALYELLKYNKAYGIVMQELEKLEQLIAEHVETENNLSTQMNVDL